MTDSESGERCDGGTAHEETDPRCAGAQDSAGTAVYPSWLKLVRGGTGCSGYYSTNDATWHLVGTITVPSAAPTQDVGLTQTSHASGTTGEADFDGFTTTP